SRLDRFDRDEPPQIILLGFVDLAHAAYGDHASDSVGAQAFRIAQVAELAPALRQPAELGGPLGMRGGELLNERCDASLILNGIEPLQETVEDSIHAGSHR